ENAHILRLILAATMSSNYGVYGPVHEFGINTPHPKQEEYMDNEKYEIKNGDRERYTKVKDVMARINKLRKENPALQSTWNIEFAETSNNQIICYTKYDEHTENAILTAVNLDPHHTQGAHVKVPIHKLGIHAGNPYRLKDCLSGSTYYWQDEW